MSVEIWESSPTTEPQLSPADVSILIDSLVIGSALWFLSCFVFFNLGFRFSQLGFFLSPAKEAEENPTHNFCDLCRQNCILYA